ncbi:MAG: hypothetical protein DMG25_02685 [Acidobacteria bacterium]|nr:MAG: hypothetical protein DMG25_02685 [Acidobacteriota bacterium]
MAGDEGRTSSVFRASKLRNYKSGGKPPHSKAVQVAFLECGSSVPLWPATKVKLARFLRQQAGSTQSGGKPPHSKALRSRYCIARNSEDANVDDSTG